MKPPRALSRISSQIEPLEARIAPAMIFIGDARETEPPGRDTPVDTEYREMNVTEAQDILFTDTSAATDAISIAVDSPLTTNTFFLRLSAGDEVRAFTNASSYQELITVNKGTAVAFFVDYNDNNNYDSGEFTGLALGADANVNIAGNVRGDVVTNLDERGTVNPADDVLSMTGLVSARQGIERLGITGGSIFGDVIPGPDPTVDPPTIQYANVLSGGDIKSLTVNGTVGNVLAASAANGATFDFYPDRSGAGPGGTIQLQPGGNGTIAVTVASGEVGASITNVRLDALGDRLEAGSGGAGAKGGNLQDIQITDDTDGFSLLAGSGGPASASAGKPKGGAGGDINKVIIAGVSDPTFNSARPVLIAAGQGGDAPATGKGGSGGIANDIFVGFELNNGIIVNSGDLLADAVVVSGGSGGDGRVGSPGGSVTAVKIRVQTPDPVQTPDDVVEDEVSVLGGQGGANLIGGGKSGAGGAVKNIDVRNQELTLGSDILISGGDGGLTIGGSKGARGGSIEEATLLGYDVRVLAGDGSGGRSGGNGGDVLGVQLVRDDEILTNNAVIDAGRGGDAVEGKAGKGGKMDGIRSLAVDLSAFTINSGSQGNGGNSTAGKGGAGGAVTGIGLFDTDTANNLRGTFTVHSGSGGDGALGGGKGGVLQNANITTLNANIVAISGDGGDATAAGKGGKAGAISLTQFTAEGTVPDPADPTLMIDASGAIVSGKGGAGKGGGAGGGGGQVKLVNINVAGSGSLIAGAGGNADPGTAKAGKGGSVKTSGVFATSGAGILQAGDAGTTGGRPANGGSIIGTASGFVAADENLSGLRASTSLLIKAGNGSNGGSGGKIQGIAYGSTALSLTPTPSDDISVIAGNGSALGNVAGRGGSLTNIFGSVSSGIDSTTSLVAGAGGGSAQRSAPGGSITKLQLSLGGGPNVLLTLQAGDAGDSTGAPKGAKGGSVKNIGVTDLDPATNFRSIAAGDGGDAGAVGGPGGSINQAFVQNHDVGVRTGQNFGFSTMGGLFAGLGGNAARDGVNGSVSNVTANAIAAIVAGRAEPGGQVPQLVKRVDHIFLNDDQLLLDRNGAFLPDGSFDPFVYSTANLVGAIANITTPDARIFKFMDLNGSPGFQVGDMPIDGILMAESLDQRTINFIPEAKLTLNRATGAQEFFDNDNQL